MIKNKSNKYLQLGYVRDLLCKGNVEVARQMLSDLLKINPNDSLILHLLIETYIKTGEYDTALSMLENGAVNRDRCLAVDLMSLYIKLGMDDSIQKAYLKYFKEKKQHNEKNRIISDIYRDQMFAYLNSNYGYDLPIENNHLVSIKMLKNYSKNATIEKLEKDNCREDRKNIFKVEDISSLYNRVKKYVNNNANNGVFQLPVFDEYFFHLDDCGMVDGESTDYFRTVTVVNTSKIIAMYPVVYSRYRDYNELVKKQNDGKKFVKTK